MPLPEEIALVPSVALMDVLGIRLQALRGVSTEHKEAELSAAFDWLFARVGKRVTRPIVTFSDNEAKRIICLRASIESLKWARGMKPEAGQDTLIKQASEDMAAYVKEIRDGNIVILCTDSTSVDEMSAKLCYNETGSDSWTKTEIIYYKPWWQFP